MNRERVILFCKVPRPGWVKTRLAQSVGSSAAVEIYRKLLQTVIQQLDGFSVELRFSPDEAEEEIRPWAKPGWAVHPQGAGDLGQRLHRAFAQHFQSGAGRVVVIGSDCPELGATDLSDAFYALLEKDLVLGPAEDGGYWLIGLRQEAPLLFENIPWSTGAVREVTLAKARQQSLEVKLLRQLPDIDTEEDWKAFLARASTIEGMPPPN